MFTDRRQKYVDPEIEPDSTARKEVGSLFIFDIAKFMTASSSFETSQTQDYYSTAPFQLHEIEGESVGGKAKAIELSGDSVFVLGEYRAYQNWREIRRFTFSN